MTRKLSLRGLWNWRDLRAGARVEPDRIIRFVPAATMLVALGFTIGSSACGSPKARIEAFRTGKATTHATGQLRRGMNFGDAMDAPHEGDWGWVISASDFHAVREAGFDHVRVPMRFSAHVDTRPPYRVDGNFFRPGDSVVYAELCNELG